MYRIVSQVFRYEVLARETKALHLQDYISKGGDDIEAWGYLHSYCDSDELFVEYVRYSQTTKDVM